MHFSQDIFLTGRSVMRYLISVMILLLFCGCSNEKQKFYKTEGHSFHFDLSEMNIPAGKSLFLYVNGKKYPVLEHNDESYQTLIDDYDSMDYTQKTHVTHFSTGIELKSGKINHLFLTDGDPRFNPDHKLLLSFYHFESATNNDILKTVNSGDNHEYACAVSAAVSMVFNHPELVTDDPEKAAIIMHHINPVEADRMCDPKAPHRQEIIDLAKAINTANKNGGSFVNEPLTVYNETPPKDESQQNMFWVEEPDDTTSLIMFKDGNPYYVYKFTDDEEPAPLPFTGDLSTKSPAVQYRPVDDVLNAAQPALLAALNETKNDQALENIKYTIIKGDGPSSGETAVEIPDSEEIAKKAVFSVTNEKIVLSKQGGIDGMSIYLDSEEITTDKDGFRYMTVKVKNYYLRHVALFLKWKTPDGSYDRDWLKKYLNDPTKEDSGLSPDFYPVFDLPTWYAFFNDVSSETYSAFWGFVSNRAVMMGIPLSPDWSYFKIPIPPTSSSAELIFASMGTGQWYNENIPGAILTSIVDLGIPAYFLASGIRDGVDGKPILKDALTDPKVITTIVSLGIAMGIYGESRKNGANNYAPYAKALGSILVNTGCDRLRYAIIKAAAKSEAENGVPFIGWGLYLAGLAANTSQLIQTIAEVSSTSAVHRNGLNATWSPKVRITPDPLNIRGGFPESAVKYKAYIFFNKHEAIELPKKDEYGTIGNTAVPHMDFIFDNIPEGGTAKIVIYLMSANGFISGYASSEVTNSLKNAPPDSNGVNYTIQLTENMVNITESTKFIHKDKIGLDSNGKHVWLGYTDSKNNYVAPPAPEKTLASLNCSSTESGLCSLFDITLSIKGHSAAYTWQSYAENTMECGSTEKSTGQKMFIENISLLNNESGGPESLIVDPKCAYLTYRPTAAYTLTGETGGNNVFVSPETIDGTVHYFVRKISVDQNLSFNMTSTASGQLNMPSTDTAVHPSGYLVSIYRDLNKMEILDLNNDPVPLEEAPYAAIISGTGDREGLLNGPAALTVSEQGDIIVLEQNNLRVSAFDVNGSVRQIFGDAENMKNYFTLANIDETFQALDIDVESTGMIFVLYYKNGGKTKNDYGIQIYSKTGELVDTALGIAAAKMAVDHFRNIFTLNYETVLSTGNMQKPTISLWTPLP